MNDRIAFRLLDAIEQDIATGALPPGARLDEVSLAERYAVSRTPVREALLQLSASGMVEMRPRRGAVVATAGPERLYEMFEVMAELEAMCGRLAARRVTPAMRATLIAAHEACARAVGDPDAYYEANEAFHLGNGARLERINLAADLSTKGVAESFGVMVNYLYDLQAVEANHERYAGAGEIVAAAGLQREFSSLMGKSAPERTQPRPAAPAVPVNG